MTESGRTPVTRRSFLRTGALAAAAPLLARAPLAEAQSPTRGISRVHDFQTSADVARAEQEGEVVYYGHDGEQGIATLLDAFKKDFPKIKTSYVRLQTGALYAKITAERSAGRFAVDVLQMSDISPVIDFQKKGGWEQYASPEYGAYKSEYQSSPVGYYGVPGVTFAGISYNRGKVKAEQAPKTWKDILNPAFKDGISAKLATSGMQHAQWYMLGKLYGNDFWQEFAKQRPKGFDARAQLFDRLAEGDDRARPAAAVNAWPARIRQRVFQGDFTQYHLDWDGRRLIVRSAASEAMAPGDEVFVSAEPRHFVLLEE